MLHAVVMAGGSGTRFWPQSRRDLPKQLLPLTGSDTLLQATVERVAPIVSAGRTWIVTNERLSAETRRQMPAVPVENVLLEPAARNTAPCIGLAAIHILRHDPDATMLVMPADHDIRPSQAFRDAVANAAKIVERDPETLVLFGVAPTYPAVGYGYIERDEALPAGGAYRVAKFREKPDLATAEGYVTSGRFFWNCGIFVWKARTIIEALRTHELEMVERLERVAAAIGTPGEKATLAAEFPQMKSISIDYAVLERAKNVCVLPATFGWDDVGSWRSLERLRTQDAHGNTVDGPFVAVNSRGCIVRTTPDHLVTAIGLDDVIIVHTSTATLVAKKDDENAIRQLIEAMHQQGYDAFL